MSYTQSAAVGLSKEEVSENNYMTQDDDIHMYHAYYERQQRRQQDKDDISTDGTGQRFMTVHASPSISTQSRDTNVPRSPS